MFGGDEVVVGVGVDGGSGGGCGGGSGEDEEEDGGDKTDPDNSSLTSESSTRV